MHMRNCRHWWQSVLLLTCVCFASLDTAAFATAWCDKPFAFQSPSTRYSSHRPPPSSCDFRWIRMGREKLGNSPLLHRKGEERRPRVIAGEGPAASDLFHAQCQRSACAGLGVVFEDRTFTLRSRYMDERSVPTMNVDR